jgi:hypothetical protein
MSIGRAFSEHSDKVILMFWFRTLLFQSKTNKEKWRLSEEVQGVRDSTNPANGAAEQL